MIIQVSYRVKWQFKEHQHYKISNCKKIINCNTGKIIKCTKSGGSVGYFINRSFFKKSDINTHIEVIPKNNCPF
jgi:hypothetical protein